MNERIRAFLTTFYAASYPSGVVVQWSPALVTKWLKEEATGDYNNRWKALLAQV